MCGGLTFFFSRGADIFNHFLFIPLKSEMTYIIFCQQRLFFLSWCLLITTQRSTVLTLNGAKRASEASLCFLVTNTEVEHPRDLDWMKPPFSRRRLCLEPALGVDDLRAAPWGSPPLLKPPCWLPGGMIPVYLAALPKATSHSGAPSSLLSPSVERPLALPALKECI